MAPTRSSARSDRTSRRRARYAVVVRTDLDVAEALGRLLDPARHAAVVPLTTLRDRGRRGPLTPGETFTMRTEVGPVRIDDRMVVDRLAVRSDGGAARFVKTGRVLRGVVLARVDPDPDRSGTARLRWDAELTVLGVPGLLDPLVAVVAHLAYGAALRRLLGGRAER